jgi:hypothetical protein
MVLGGALFLGLLWRTAGARTAAFMALPVIGMMLLNHRLIRFCDGCGRTVQAHVFWSRPRFCPSCGHALDAPPPAGPVPR